MSFETASVKHNQLFVFEEILSLLACYIFRENGSAAVHVNTPEQDNVYTTYFLFKSLSFFGIGRLNLCKLQINGNVINSSNAGFARADRLS